MDKLGESAAGGSSTPDRQLSTSSSFDFSTLTSAAASAASAAMSAAGGDAPGVVTITVKAGDSLSSLALALYGDASLAWALGGFSQRPLDKPESLRVGDKISIPCTWTNVKPGETLSAVAQRTLGDDRKYGRIKAANQAIQNVNQIQAGQRLAIPISPLVPSTT